MSDLRLPVMDAKKTRLTNEQVRAMVAHYRAGASLEATAKHFGVSRRCVQYRVHQAGAMRENIAKPNPRVERIIKDVPLDPEDIYRGGWVRDGLILRPAEAS